MNELNRVITVKGRAEVSVKPDTVLLSFDIKSQDRQYSKCIRELNCRLEKLRSEIESAGIDRENLKTTSFRVLADYEWIDDRKVFMGYVASHLAILELPFNKEKLNRVLNILGNSESRADINISFNVKHREELCHKALEKAVKNAHKKAQVLAKAAGVELGDLIKIEYGWAEVRIRSSSHSMPAVLLEETKQFYYDISPAEVKIEESVTMVWEIK